MLAKKKRGPAPTGKGQQVVVRLHPPLMSPLDAWIDQQPAPKPTRAEAIRRLLGQALNIQASSPSLDERITDAEERASRPIPKAKSPAKGMAQMRKGHAENEIRKLVARKKKSKAS